MKYKIKNQNELVVNFVLKYLLVTKICNTTRKKFMK